MPASPLDSVIYRGLLGDAELATLFSDAAELRAMLLVEGALALAQGEAGLIPAESAAFIARAAREVAIDPALLAAETATNGVPIPGMVAAFRKAMAAPDHARYLHWGATSQDILDSGLALRLRALLALLEGRLVALLGTLADLAEAHAELPMAARTYGQVATPTSLGAVIAGWGWPLLTALERLRALRPGLLCVSLSGAAGTLSVMGAAGPQIRAAMARELGLGDPGHSWHSQRDRIAGFAAWMTGLGTALGRIGEDLILATQTGISELRLASGGGSSTMPQKVNPVQPSVLVALARQAVALDAALQGAALHRQQRDGAAWFVEWMSLPQLCQVTGRALGLAVEMLPGLVPDAAQLRLAIDDGTGLIYAEALTFALTDRMPRPEAQAEVKALCARVTAEGRALPELAAERWPETDWLTLLRPEAQLGLAPAEARAFAGAARAT